MDGDFVSYLRLPHSHFIPHPFPYSWWFTFASHTAEAIIAWNLTR